jgi:hypothetical protein
VTTPIVSPGPGPGKQDALASLPSWLELRARAAALSPDELHTMTGGESPAPTRPAHHLDWQELCRGLPALAAYSASPIPHAPGLPPPDLSEAAPPPPMPEADLRGLLGSLLHPRHRRLLAPVLLGLLSEGVADIAVAVAGEVGRARVA